MIKDRIPQKRANKAMLDTYTPRLRSTPGAVLLARARRWSHQHVQGTAAKCHLGLEDEAAPFSLSSGKRTGVSAKLGCTGEKKKRKTPSKQWNSAESLVDGHTDATSLPVIIHAAAGIFDILSFNTQNPLCCVQFRILKSWCFALTFPWS